MMNSHATLTESILHDTAPRRPCCSGKVVLMCFLLIGSGIQLLMSLGKQLFTSQDLATNLAWGIMQAMKAGNVVRAPQFPQMARVRQLTLTAIMQATPLDDLERSLIKLYEEQKHEINQLHARMDVNRPPEFGDQATDFAKMKHLTTIMPLGLNRVYLKTSQVHGQGVFASRNISAGEVVTFYPADIVIYSPQGKQPGVRALYPSTRLQDVLDQTPNALQDSYCRNRDYMLGASTCGLASWSLVGDPRFDSNADYMGHFVNDAAMCGRSERAKQAYESEKRQKANCKYVVLKKELHVAIVATKRVAKDEELFVPYGCEYWESWHERMSAALISETSKLGIR